MQVYRGMDIITNKVPESERHGVEHALMSFKNPGEQYVVGQWVQDALAVIDETHKRKEIPIIVGGTSYWIQHLIFPGRLSKSTPFTARESTSSSSSPSPSEVVPLSADLQNALSLLPQNLQDLWLNLPDVPFSAAEEPKSAMDLHQLLSGLDPDVASRWHWCDTRKVFRSLGIIKEMGRRPSEIIKEQSEEDVKPRFRTLCFWLYAEPDVLNPRLDARVDDMIKQGVLEELQELHDLTQSPSSSEADYTLGIYQSIGYREFHTYLSLPPSQRTAESFTQATDLMKLSTRQYAKRQIKWIRNTLLPAAYGHKDMVKPYLLDATELGEAWDVNVLGKGVGVTEGFLEGNTATLPRPFSLSPTAARLLDVPTKTTNPHSTLLARRKTTCPICTTDPQQPVMIEEGKEWERHVKSRSHRSLAGKGRREAEAKAGMEEKREARRRAREELERVGEGKEVGGGLREVLAG